MRKELSDGFDVNFAVVSDSLDLRLLGLEASSVLKMRNGTDFSDEENSGPVLYLHFKQVSQVRYAGRGNFLISSSKNKTLHCHRQMICESLKKFEKFIAQKERKRALEIIKFKFNYDTALQ